MEKVLLIENNKEIGEIIQFFLRKDYETTLVESAEDAFFLITNNRFDVILLDILLPGMNGIEFCSKIREQVFCPIIFISCLSDEKTIVNGLNMGGDDYIVKPFKAPLLIAHIEANLRRSKVRHEEKDLSIHGLTLHHETHKVTKYDQQIILSPIEYEILYYLMHNRGKLVTFEDLYTSVWHQNSIGDVRTVFVHIRNIRKKIEDDPNNPCYIKTERHLGYYFLDDAE
jgi:DNA-binding response OmpR family regulator